ncbi:hypothetical protein RSOLAG22IIIB_05638 [Rhizoctonia solani]|uniref:Transcobalamin-like C-terminal domain-containing protein n=1 Tax=Rhizoctonia solani TaxID=456999 RepID=A0A0K6G827_9AGAM|nr:hypothetical protein RSOLAG22IIIB_05638 [Rhizoctonia solani]
MVRLASLVLGSVATFVPLSFASPVATHEIVERQRIGTSVNVRIEGATSTIFEGTVITKGRDVKTPSGGSHHCDGTNNGQNPAPGPTCTSALADVADLSGIKWDGTWDANFDDFFVTRIGGSTQTSSQFWGLLLNWQFTPVGGCQQQVAAGDTILWAFDAFSKTYFLKLDGPSTAKVGVPIQVLVIDGSSGDKISGATIAGYPSSSDNDGNLSLTFTSAGKKKLKAQRPDSLRSNALTIQVTS